MKGRRRPKRVWQPSLNEPRAGTKKKPMNGGKHQVQVINITGKPISKRIGETNAVSAA